MPATNAVWELFRSTLVSGKMGIPLVFPPSQTIRAILVYTRRIRPSRNPYVNKKYEPNKGYLGTITGIYKNFVVSERELHYPNEAFFVHSFGEGEIMRQISCINQEILQSIANLGVNLGLIPTPIENETQLWYRTPFYPDTLQICLEPNVAVQFDTFILRMDVCQELLPSDPADDPAPDPPETIPPYPGDEANPDGTVSPDTALPITEPLDTPSNSSYDPDPLDDENRPTDPTGRAGVWNVYSIWRPYTEFSGTDVVAGYADDAPNWVQVGDVGAANLIAFGSDRRTMLSTPGLSGRPDGRIELGSAVFVPASEP